MDILQLYQDHGIPHQTEGHKHCRPGWVNTPCPFCTGNEGLHLGATLDGKLFRCWRCGIHFPDKVIAKLLGVSFTEAKKVIIDYAGFSAPSKEVTGIKIRTKAHKLPSNTKPLTDSHKRYLVLRDFSPPVLEKEWNLISTGPVSLLDKVNYKHRIIAPIYWEGKQVTFQARDVTNKHPIKYLACPKDRELIHHKHILYRHPDSTGDVGICVEGITDVWRLGRNSFGVFGIEYTPQQVRLISSLYKKVIVFFDSEPQAIKKAKQLAGDLSFRGVETCIHILTEGDPGSMFQEDADKLVKKLMK
jgi:DNA primase